MAAALGVCGAAMLNKVRDPSVTWNKGKRGTGIEQQLEGVDEIVPLWSSSKGSSIRIFGSENPIMENKVQYTALPEPITVRIGEEEEEEEETTPEAEAPADEEVVAETSAPVAAAVAVTEVIDEAAETINAAVDAAIQSAAAVASGASEPAASSVSETAAPTEPIPAHTPTQD